MTHELALTKKTDILVKYWPIIVSIVLLIGAWFTLKTSVDANTGNISKLQTHQETIDTNQTQILVQLSQIQADISWVKERLNKI